MKGAEGSRWRLVEDVEFLTREWEGQLALFHGGSGDTHLLEGIAMRIYTMLRQGPAATDELLAVVETTPETSHGEEVSPSSDLMRTLGMLQRLDIVEPLLSEAVSSSQR